MKQAQIVLALGDDFKWLAHGRGL